MFDYKQDLTIRGSCPDKNPLLVETDILHWSGDLPSCWQPVERELKITVVQLEEILRPTGRSLLKQLLPPLDFEFLLSPALVLFCEHLFAKEGKYLPAVFMELIFLGTRFLNLAGQLKDKTQQLYTLTGDLLFSHLYHLLWESEQLSLLEGFATLITVMNEGFAKKEEFRLKGYLPGEEEIHQWLYKQFGFFYGESCALGSRFAGGSDSEQSILKEFGIDFGIAFGAKRNGCSFSLVEKSLEKGLISLSLLPESQGRRDLEFFARGIIAVPCKAGLGNKEDDQ